jgi:haloalkane dehalogenase
MVMKTFSLVMGSRPMRTLIVKRNFFVTTLMKQMLQAKLTNEEFDHYVKVVPTPQSRTGIAEFPRQIRAAGPWLADLERRVESTLTDRPMLLFRGTKDPAFGSKAVLQRWQAAFPQATTIDLDNAGHYIQEDAPEAIIDGIVDAFRPDAG